MEIFVVYTYIILVRIT